MDDQCCFNCCYTPSTTKPLSRYFLVTEITEIMYYSLILEKGQNTYIECQKYYKCAISYNRYIFSVTVSIFDLANEIFLSWL